MWWRRNPVGWCGFVFLSVLDVGLSRHVNERGEGSREEGCWEKAVRKNSWERGRGRPRLSKVKGKRIAKRGGSWFDKWAEWSNGKREVLSYFYISPCGSPCSLDLSIIMTETPKLTCFFSLPTPNPFFPPISLCSALLCRFYCWFKAIYCKWINRLYIVASHTEIAYWLTITILSMHSWLWQWAHTHTVLQCPPHHHSHPKGLFFLVQALWSSLHCHKQFIWP